MFLFLTRHGETQWNRLKKTQGTLDTYLTDLGRMQAERLGKRLRRQNDINTIYCSDLTRARETAEIIGDNIGVKPIANELLREVSFGHWEGLSIKEIENKYPGQLARWRNELSFSPKGGENLFSVHCRIRSFIRMLEDNHQSHNENILIVSHAATIKVLILELIGIPLNLLSNIKISQTGLSLIDKSESNNSIIYMNDTCHIDI